MEEMRTMTLTGRDSPVMGRLGVGGGGGSTNQKGLPALLHLTSV